MPKYEMDVYAQDSSVGRVGVVLDAIADAAKQAGGYAWVDVAVAYASVEGVRMLNQRLSGGIWNGAQKRFLVSIDFGFTQPDALTRLSELHGAEVRVPNGRAVLREPTLRPPYAFHAKTFAFGTDEPHDVRDQGLVRAANLNALIVGSANLTASALSTGAEVVTKQVWTGSAGWRERMRAKPVLSWFEDTWEAADPLPDVVEEYRLRHRAMPRPEQLLEDSTPAARRYLAPSDSHEISGALPVQLAAAKSLWVDVSSIIHNRKQLPGTQLNTPRGTRVFFGFGSEKVPKNRTLGAVNMRVGAHPYVERTVRFSDNSMDIVNLPIPEHNGLETYEGTILVFTRDSPAPSGLSQFTLTVTDAPGLDEKKKAVSNSIELKMNGGRKYGLLF
ncbi:hypothetical protein OUO20_16050 [Arthrobacter sp. FX8]|uniref:hypothetical protein n=1 Tax=Arthrobacter sp. FX8 TaxID=2997335 RepID=UPI00227C5308|nr:hypothetical protein [Arthrobacter sp. FX8]WAJ32618.1 hypothetical protein OUO20_16050 [Arthrobacter sp. FX8]